MDENDTQYLESVRYSKEAFFVLPLPSGAIAILTPRRDFFAVCANWEEAKALGPRAEDHQLQSERKKHAQAIAFHEDFALDVSDLNLSDLNLDLGV